MDFSKEIKKNIETLITSFADEYLIDKPVAYCWALNSTIHQELEKLVKHIKESNNG